MEEKFDEAPEVKLSSVEVDVEPEMTDEKVENQAAAPPIKYAAITIQIPPVPASSSNMKQSDVSSLLQGRVVGIGSGGGESREGRFAATGGVAVGAAGERGHTAKVDNVGDGGGVMSEKMASLREEGSVIELWIPARVKKMS